MSANARTDWKIDPALLAGREQVARLALSKTEAAQSLGVSVTYFEQHIAPDLRIARKGRRCLIPVRELDRWLESNATRTLPSGT